MADEGRLNNGAVIIEEVRVNRDERIVLAKWDRGDGLPEFVTWSVSNGGDAFSGHYFDKVTDAAIDFRDRSRVVRV